MFQCASGVFSAFGYLVAAQDINKWRAVDASLKNPFSITSIHTTAVESYVQTILYVRQTESKQQEFFSDRKNETKNWLDFQVTYDTVYGYYMIHVTTSNLIPYNDFKRPFILGLN